jgi:hypothetical protein
VARIDLFRFLPLPDKATEDSIKRRLMMLTYVRLLFSAALLAGSLSRSIIAEASEPCALNGPVVNAVNEMSASVGGSGFPSLNCVDFPGGREVQMDVVDTSGRRWILGVDLATAAPRTRLSVAGDGAALLVVDAAAEPRYGMLGGQSVDSVAGQAINQELAKLGSARINTITVSDSQQAAFLVSWKSAGSDAKGQFLVDSKGTVSSP